MSASKVMGKHNEFEFSLVSLIKLKLSEHLYANNNIKIFQDIILAKLVSHKNVAVRDSSLIAHNTCFSLQMHSAS